ncbi:MAG: hypothetical protein ABI378_09545 [Chitinophagaceae bacterium]
MSFLKKFPALVVLLFASLGFLFAFPPSAQAHNKKKKHEEVKVKTIYEIDTLVHPIPRNRELFHVYLNRAVRGADASDGKVDGYIWFGDDTLASNAITNAMLHMVPHIDTMIENLPFNDAQIENQTKIGYIRYLTNLVTKFNRDVNPDAFFYRKVVINFHDMLIVKHENRLPEFIKHHANIYSMFNEELLDDDKDSRAYLYRTVGAAEPLMMIRKLKEYANEPFACDIIAAAARVSPNEVYKYASSTNATLHGAIVRCKDPLVMAIVKITNESKSPLKAMSFISDIYNNRLTIAEIDKITADETLFFKNLVRLKMQGDTLGGATYSDELSYRANRLFVSTINELHESPDPVRFKCLDGLTPAELYFIIVYGQDQIYTSSFIGAFNRMMDRLKPRPGGELLDTVHYDHFRTFIRMCAGYSKLSEFLSTMSTEKKSDLMKQFISGLENGKSDDLEDAVDVADAFGSVKDPALADFLYNQIVDNYTRVSNARNEKGTIVYGLLATLANKNISDSLSQILHLPPINRMPFASLLDDSGVLYEQFFFYGDEDGRSSFANFLGDFKDGKWKEERNAQWTKFSSTQGKKIVVFANLPLDYESELDDKAQKALKVYMDANNIHPTIIVHRGHSYHLNSTIDYMAKPNHIIILGSCGGYHNLGKVLTQAPNANLISTKQTGTMMVNDAIIKAMNNHLLAGDDLDWKSLWAELSASFAGKGKADEDFKEYVPPNRNLGAIFIKAYRRMKNEAETKND